MNKYLIWGAGVLVLVAGAFVLFSNQSGKKAPVAPATSITATPTPIESPTSADTVTLTSTGFEPQTLKVKTGTKVTFVNKSGETAAVNSAVHPTHTLFPLLNLGTFNDGESLSVTFDKVGTYKYHNHLNSSQTGTVVVE